MATSNNVLISVQHLVKEYNHGAVHALNDCSLDICKGEVVAIIGPSGSGKSTLLRSLNLLEQPTSGAIFFDGADLAAGWFLQQIQRAQQGGFAGAGGADDGHHLALPDVQIAVVQRFYGAAVIFLHQMLHGDELIACRHDASSFQWLRWPWRPDS